MHCDKVASQSFPHLGGFIWGMLKIPDDLCSSLQELQILMS